MPRLAKCSVSLWTMVTMKLLWGKCVQYFNRAPNNPKINQTSESLKLIETDVYRNTSQPRSLHSDVFCYVVSHVTAIYSPLTFMKSRFVLFCFHVFLTFTNCCQEIDQQHGGHPFIDCCDLRSPDLPIEWMPFWPRRRLYRFHHEEDSVGMTFGGMFFLMEVQLFLDEIL